MKIIIDESVSYGLRAILQQESHEIVAIAEAATAGQADTEVFKLASELVS